MRLPDDFWSVNEQEPGIGGTVLAGLIFVGVVFGLPALILVLAAATQ